MKINKDKIGRNILVACLSISGMVSISVGAVLNNLEVKKPINKVKINVIEKSTAKKDAEPILKEISIEVNMPLSVDVKDYIENIESLDKNVLKKCKLDTSLVNVNEKGTYTYQITYKDKKYNGIVKVEEKEAPIIDNITLKNIRLELGSSLPKNLNDYITEEIPEEAKKEILIDLTKVNTKEVGNYQYTVSYQNKIYTGNIEIYDNNKQTFIEDNSTKNNNNNNATVAPVQTPSTSDAQQAETPQTDQNNSQEEVQQ